MTQINRVNKRSVKKSTPEPVAVAPVIKSKKKNRKKTTKKTTKK